MLQGMALRRIDNPPNPWHATDVEWVGEPPPARLETFVDSSREILSRNDSPDIEFTYSLNPYRGCIHGCAYCYARPSHEYLGFGAGTDFERRIVVKPDAPRLLERAFRRRAWAGDVVAFSGNTDCYQPIESSYGLTRACLEVCLRYRNPVSIITKSPLIERDADLLRALAEEAFCAVTISVPFFNAGHARALEPYVPPPARRLRALGFLASRGIPVGVNFAPVVPGLADAEMVDVLTRAADLGARWAGFTILRLPGPVAGIFEARLRETLPNRADRVLNRLAEIRGGRRDDRRFGTRMRGEGPYAEAIATLFRSTCRRLGLERHPKPPVPSTFRRPIETGAQLSLFR